MANLSLKNVTKVYRREYCAVDNLSLEIDDKEFVVIIGPSGSGKTAILRMMAGLEKVTSGEIYIDGRRVDQLPMRKRDIGLCSSNRKLNGFKTIYGNDCSKCTFKQGLVLKRERHEYSVRRIRLAKCYFQLFAREK